MYRSDSSDEIIREPLLKGLAFAFLAGMWLPSFFGVPVPGRLPVDFQGYLYARLHAGWDPASWSATLVAMALVVFCPYALRFGGRWIGISRKESLFTVYFLFLLTGVSATGHCLSPGVYGMFFMTLALLRFLNVERFSVWSACDTMLLLSAGSLFTLHLAWYAPVFLAGMALIKRFTARNLSAACMGFVTPYLLVAALAYLRGHFGLFRVYMSNVFQSVGFYPDNDRSSWFGLALLAVAGIMALSRFRRGYSADKLQARQSVTFVYILLAVSVALRYLFPQPALQTTPVTLLLLSMVLSHGFAAGGGRPSRIRFALLSSLCALYYLFASVIGPAVGI